MKVRVISTGFETFIQSYLALPTHIVKINLPYHFGEKKFFILNGDNNEEELMEFHAESTRRQYVEAWQALGLVKKDLNKTFILKSGQDRNAVLETAKKALLLEEDDQKIQELKNMRLLCVFNLINPITDEEIKKSEISQTKGELTVLKINKETSKFEMELAKDKYWTNDVRRKIHEKTNGKL